MRKIYEKPLTEKVGIINYSFLDLHSKGNNLWEQELTPDDPEYDEDGRANQTLVWDKMDDSFQ